MSNLNVTYEEMHSAAAKLKAVAPRSRVSSAS